jgi:prepilin-type processing-associated H-X9-DG protein
LTLWNNSTGEDGGQGSRILGYAETFDGTSLFGDDPPWYFSTNTNTKLTASTVANSFSTTFPISVSSRVLLACSTITALDNLSTSLATMETYQWVGLPHDLDPDVPVQKSFTTSHLINATLPSGGNQAMVDGHVEWRPFGQMIPRAGSGAPVFYW